MPDRPTPSVHQSAPGVLATTLGMTPHAYLVQRRLALARSLLAGGQSIAEAATAAGFADQAHLTRVFRRCLGYTPAAYARARA